MPSGTSAPSAMPAPAPSPAATPIQYQPPIGASLALTISLQIFRLARSGGGDKPHMRAETPLLAFFTEARSGPARRMESLLAHLARKERDRLRVTRVDVAEKPDVAERMHVEKVPTLLLIKDGRVVGRLEGRVSAPRIERLLEKHLEPVEAV